MRQLFGVQLPEKGDLPAPPRSVILHWTGGAGKANSVDLSAYHYVVEHDGTVKAGKHPVSANMRTLKSSDVYAAHTGGFNSYRIGISGAGMKGYINPKHPGTHHLSIEQVHRMCALAAYFCETFDLDPLDPARLCTHQEVWTIHGVKGKQNHQKTDIEWLAFRTDLGKSVVGTYLRKLAKSYMKEEAPVPTLSVPKPPSLFRRIRTAISKW